MSRDIITIPGSTVKNLKRPLIFGWKRDGKFLYIGKSLNGIHPIYHHGIIGCWEEIKETDEFVIWFVSAKEIRHIGNALIDTYRPILNAEVRNTGSGNFLGIGL